jgi:raffinose/stachyose/melibiose transport system permease protein
MSNTFVKNEASIRLQEMSAAKRRKRIKTHFKALLFLAPIIVSMGLFKYFPFFTAIVKSLFEWNGANIDRFIGISNYTRLFQDETFHTSLRNIGLFTGSSVLINLIFPLFAAIVISHMVSGKAQNAVKTLFLVPLVVPYIIIYLLWRWIYMGDGVINGFLTVIGLEQWTQAWLGDSDLALWSLVFVNFPWIGGIYFLIYLAGMITISPELYEVGRIDGIGKWQRFWRIELPLIKNQIRLVVMLAFINQFQSFENVLVLTNGGPGFSTLTPALYLYKSGFEYNEFGYASAIGVVVFAILAIVTLIFNLSVKTSDSLD